MTDSETWAGKDAAAGDTVEFTYFGPFGPEEVLSGTLCMQSRNWHYVLTENEQEGRVLWEVDNRTGQTFDGGFGVGGDCGVIIGDDWPDGTIEEVLEDGRLRISVPDRGEFLVRFPSFHGEPVDAGART